MSDNGDTELKHSGFFVVRTPLMPRLSVDRVGNSCSLADLIDFYDEAVAEQPEILRNYVESLALGIRISGSEFERLINPAEKPLENGISARLKRRVSFAKYFLRLSGRSTPFGIFATFAYGDINNNTNLEIGERNSVYIHSFPSGMVISDVEQFIQAGGQAKISRPVRVNPSAYYFGDRIRFIVRTTDEKKYWKSRDDKLTKFLRSALKHGRKYSYSDLVKQFIIDSGGASDEIKAEEHLRRLIRKGVLIPESDHTIFHADSLTHIAKQYSETDCQDGTSIIAAINALVTSYKSLNCSVDFSSVSSISKFAAKVDAAENSIRMAAIPFRRIPEECADSEHIGGKIPTRFRAFHIDAERQSDRFSLSDALADRVLDSARAIVYRTAHEHPALAILTESFVRRFGDGPVPVGVALDQDFGAVADGIIRRPSSSSYNRNLTDFLIEKVALVARDGGWEDGINLSRMPIDREAVKAFREHAPSGTVMFSLRRSTNSGITDGYDVCITGVGPGTGLEMISRFATNSKKMVAMSEVHLEKTKPCGVKCIDAEVVFAGNGSMRDVTIRPRLTQYVIDISGTQKIEDEYRIDISDLFLVHDSGKLLLFSERLGSIIRPILSSAHVYQNDAHPSIYKWLPVLGKPLNFGFEWPDAFRNAPCLPRVHVNGVWIRPALWRIPDSLRHAISKAKWKGKIEAFRAFLLENKVPRFVDVGYYDQRLSVDTTCDDAVAAACSVIKDRNVDIQEAFQRFGLDAISDTDGRGFGSEFTMPFYSENAMKVERRQNKLLVENIRPSEFRSVVGISSPSDWTFWKIYCPPRSANRILADKIQPFLKAIADMDLLDKWFFIRYGDPDYHIRLRVKAKGHDSNLRLREVSAIYFDDLVEKHIIQKWVTDIYKPEYVRYGGIRMYSLAEDIFYRDSLLAMSFLEQTLSLRSDERRLELRRHMCNSVNIIISAGCSTGHERRNIVEILKSVYMKTMDIGASDIRNITSINKNVYKSAIRLDSGLVDGGNAICSRMKDFYDGYYNELCTLFARMRDIISAGNSTKSLDSIIFSLIHMSANRSMREWNMTEEFAAVENVRRFQLMTDNIAASG